MRDHAVSETAAQVSHDIRSPLTALNSVLKDLPELPERKRILVRNATQRIGDIANNLLLQYRTNNYKNSDINQQKTLKPELVLSLLDSLVSEKRIQMMEKSIDLKLEAGSDTHCCFVNLKANEFKRMISNLINNAIDAIELGGIIRVVLRKEVDDLAIKIIDNGKSIPEKILPKIKKGGISIGKQGGSGLGISGVIQNIKKWNGHYDIQSKEGKGTTFIIKLPITGTPDWFQNSISIMPNTHVVVLDDDKSSHDIWEMHFQDYLKNKQIRLDHFYNSSIFAQYCKDLLSEHDLFLIDYELLASSETGLDLIERLNIKDQAILVTSRYEELWIKTRAKELSLKIIPKNFAPYIPISILGKSGATC